MCLTSRAAHSLRGTIELPGDKSVTHRALWLGALARGVTRIARPNQGADCLGLARCLEALGVTVERGEAEWSVHGGEGGFAAPTGRLDFGNSGTAARLGLGALAGTVPLAELDGDASLRRRPMERVVEPLRRMGAEIEGGDGGRHLPLAVRGRALAGAEHALPLASAQVKSALLLAGLAARGRTRIVEPAPTRDHTERLLPLFGATIQDAPATAGRPHEVRLEGPQQLTACAVQVPADFSAAAFWLVAATLVPDSEIAVREVALNPWRTGLLAVLERMGADLEVRPTGHSAGEPLGTVRARTASLTATDIPPAEVPGLVDEIPIWAIAAACAAGRSVLRGAADLRAKESDRLRGLAEGLGRLGVRVEERADGLVIEGMAGAPLSGGTLDAAHDHRLAMAFLVAGLVARDPVEVTAGEMVDTSYPDFYPTLSNLVSAR